MELKNEVTSDDNAFILRPAVAALTCKQPPIPKTARFDILDCDQRLRMRVKPPDDVPDGSASATGRGFRMLRQDS
jgi:hypothetical protein